MNKLFKTLSFVFIVMLIALAFAQARQATAAPKDLPYGLTLQNTRASVEQNSGHPRVYHAPQAGWAPGLPDSGSSPDYTHYWAVYKRFDVTIIYNSPSPTDQNATIADIVVSE
ncbi:MAG TPA: hypothetical protein VMN99_01615 [Anaerolineales bacterium]|nr:hypothetical protein [Anaerolineales bacterium]